MRNTKRPGIITALCALGLAGTVISFVQVFSPSIKKLGILMPAVYGIIICSYFISYIGLWHMKRWGTELFIASFVSSLSFSLFTGTFGLGNILGILFAIVYAIIVAFYYKKMDVNL
jgi:predicted outer membrane lipoprotein